MLLQILIRKFAPRGGVLPQWHFKASTPAHAIKKPQGRAAADICKKVLPFAGNSATRAAFF